MSGVRVFGLSAEVTDKQLKVYFSNPRNGGGRVDKIYYPLPHNSAVVIFGDKQVADEVIKRQHRIFDNDVDVSPLPRSVYRRVVTEVQKDVSDFLSLNTQLVEELQFIGEINVNFNYEIERYFLDGSWYQLEWALHYLDTMLEAFQFEFHGSTGYVPQKRSGATPAPRTTSAQRQPILRPNIPSPLGSGPRMTNLGSGPRMTNFGSGSRMTNIEKFAPNLSLQPSKPKNKNAAGLSAAMEPTSLSHKMLGDTVRSNLDKGEKRYHGDENWKSNDASGFQGDDSDSENEALLAAQYDRNVGFSEHTNFQEKPSKGQSSMPRMTMGIDVAQTDFGKAPLTFSFELDGGLHIEVSYDDITKQVTDAIVNPTTQHLSNVFGVSQAVSKAAGPDMQRACNEFLEENGPLEIADVMHTGAGGKLSAKMASVLHVVGPHWRESDSEICTHLLVCTYVNCFQYADQKLWTKSLATPLISAGNFGFPLDVCIGAFYDAILMFSTRQSSTRHLKEIHLVCFDKDSAMATIMIIQSLLDCEKSQAAISAKDRYWLRSQKFNFQAKYFLSLRDDDEHSSDSSGNEAENEPKTGNVKRGADDREARDADSDRVDEKDSEMNGALAAGLVRVSLGTHSESIVNTATDRDRSFERDEEAERDSQSMVVAERRQKPASDYSPTEQPPERIMRNKVDSSEDETENDDTENVLSEVHAVTRKFSFEQDTTETKAENVTFDMRNEEKRANETGDSSDEDKEEMMPVFCDLDERVGETYKVENANFTENDVNTSACGAPIGQDTDIQNEAEKTVEEEDDEGMFL